MLPLDNVKTHCQAGSHLSLTQIMKNIYNSGGISNFYSGSSVLAMGCIPAHAIYFSIYEIAKKRLNC
jgi:solute carrier family 25 iron transporter 28/37